MKASHCCIDWKTGGIIIGIFSLIGSFPISASGDVSVSCKLFCFSSLFFIFYCFISSINSLFRMFIVHFLVVSSCLLYGIHKVNIRLINLLNLKCIELCGVFFFSFVFFYDQEKSEFLLPYLVELVIILIQCALSIIKFILLDPYDEDSFESDIAYDLFYDRPKHLTKEEKRFILAVFIITSIGIGVFFSLVNLFLINLQIIYSSIFMYYSDFLFLVYNIYIVPTYAVL